jgi:porin
MKWFGGLLVGLILAVSSAHASQADGADEAFLGGPTSIGKELEEAGEVASESVWSLGAFRARLIERYGLAVSADYATLYQYADDSLTGSDNGLGGVLRLYGRWTLVGRGTGHAGTLVARVEHRHQLSGDVAPGHLASELGYHGAVGFGFTDVGVFLAPFYWEQFFADGHLGVVAGRLDPIDFTDVLGVGSQWSSFQNTAVLSNMSIAAPDIGCGLGVGFRVNEHWVIATTAHDANGKQTEFNCFEGTLRLFEQARVSWTPTRARRFANAMHLTVWHQDERPAIRLEESYGVAASGNWAVNDRWMPFFRWGLSEGDAPQARQQLTTGLMLNIPGRSDQLGVGAWWQDLSHRDLDDQSGMEVFYRWALIPNLAITPSIQLLNDPALNPDADRIILLGVRVRVLFF